MIPIKAETCSLSLPDSTTLSKILFITDRRLDTMHGETTHVTNVVNALSSNSKVQSLHVLLPHSSDRFHDDVLQIPYHRADGMGIVQRLLASVNLLKQMRKEVTRTQPDLVYVRSSVPLTPLIPILVRISGSTPVLLEMNGLAYEELKVQNRARIVRGLLRIFEARLLNSSAGIIAVSEGIRTSLAARGVRKIHVIENGVDITRFHPTSVNESLDSAMEISDGQRVVGFVGNIMKWQGIDILVQAAQAILRERQDVVFVVVGGGPDLESVKDMVKQQRLEAAFRFLGPVAHENVPGLIRRFDCAVTPTRNLGATGAGRSSLKTLEYLACGIPVVASRFSTQPSLIELYDLGVEVEPDNYEALSKGIKRVLSLEDSERLDLSNRAAMAVQRQHSWESVVERILKVAEQLESDAYCSTFASSDSNE